MNASTSRIGNGICTDTPTEEHYILVVDDEPLLCRMLSTMLKRAGYETHVVMDGMAALESVEQRLPDLITLDVMMPDISGLEVAKELRSDPRTVNIPIVFLTAVDRSVSMELRRWAEQPRIYHLDKPFSRQKLVDRVSAALGEKVQ